MVVFCQWVVESPKPALQIFPWVACRSDVSFIKFKALAQLPGSITVTGGGTKSWDVSLSGFSGSAQHRARCLERMRFEHPMVLNVMVLSLTHTQSCWIICRSPSKISSTQGRGQMEWDRRGFEDVRS